MQGTKLNYGKASTSRSNTFDGFICSECNLVFSNVSNLNTHLYRVHEASRSSDNSSSDEIGELFSDIFKRTKQTVADIAKKASNLHQSQRLSKGQSKIPYEANDNQDEVVQIKFYSAHYKNLNTNRCFETGCNKNLGLLSSKINCKRCGEVFCIDHCDLPMRLDPNTAQHDVNSKNWANVCFSCFKSKPGYKECEGATRDLSSAFLSSRRKKIDKVQLEYNLVESRLDKFKEILTSPKAVTSSNFKKIEQSIVYWQPDKEVTACPYCNLSFKTLPINRRRHHCRLCGKVVCGTKNCADKFEILPSQGDESSSQPIHILICKNCHTLTDKIELRNSKNSTIWVVESQYKNLKQIQNTIQQTLPKFNEAVGKLQDIRTKQGSKLNEADNDVQVASNFRIELLGAFSKYDSIIQLMRKLVMNSKSPANLQSRLLNAIIAAAINFLQLHTVSLSVLPRLLQKDRSNSSPASSIESIPTTSVKLPSEPSHLDVFREQIDNLDRLIKEATANRNFEDVKALTLARKEILDEIELMS